MVVKCNVCPTNTKAIVWFKFVNTPWIPFIPKKFPFAYRTYPILGTNDVRLTFYSQPINPPRRWQVNIKFDNYSTGAIGQTAFVNATTLDAGYFWGDTTEVNVEIETRVGGSVPPYNSQGTIVCDKYYVAVAKNRCGNKTEVGLYTANSPRIYVLEPSCQPAARVASKDIATGSPYVFSRFLQPYNLFTDACGDCPSGWHIEYGSIVGQGEPIVEVTCGSLKCPPDTECQCTNPKSGITCCYNINGKPIFKFK